MLSIIFTIYKTLSMHPTKAYIFPPISTELSRFIAYPAGISIRLTSIGFFGSVTSNIFKPL